MQSKGIWKAPTAVPESRTYVLLYFTLPYVDTNAVATDDEWQSPRLYPEVATSATNKKVIFATGVTNKSLFLIL